MTSHPRAARRRSTVAALATGTALACAASAPAAPVTVTLAFDDGMGTRNDPAQILAPTGTRATFFVNTANVDKATTSEAWSREYLSWEQLAELHDAGHEIAGHTLHHVRLTPPDPAPPTTEPPTDPPGGDPPVTDPAAGEPPAAAPPPTDPGASGPTEEEIRTEVCADREALTDAGYAARSFAYPYGRSDARSRAIVAACDYISGRTTSAPTPAEALPPVNPFALEAANTGGMSGAQLLALVDAAKHGGGGWVQLVFHDICDTDDDLCNGTPRETVTPRALKDLVAGLAADRDVRVRTAGDVVGADAEATPPAFAPTGVGTTSTASAVIRNAGGAPLRLGTTRLTGGGGRFAVITDSCGGTAVPAGGSCAVSVRFSPTAAGTATARLLLPGNTDPRTTVVPLAATGAAVAPPPADPPVEPPSGPPAGDPTDGAGAVSGGSDGSSGSNGASAPGAPGGPGQDIPTGAAPAPGAALVEPPASTPAARVDAAQRAAVRRTRTRLRNARARALLLCGRKANRRARVACRGRTRARYARRLRSVTVVRASTARR